MSGVAHIPVSGLLLFVLLLPLALSVDYLSAPWTPFLENGDVAFERIPAIAEYHKARGVTVVWINGGLSQWASLTLEERTMLAELWVHECKRLGMKTVVHVSHMCLRTARDLAMHAAKIGADSIGMYPPFAPEAPPDLAAVARSIEFATHDVDLPLFYYHIPAVTGVFLNVSDLIEYSKAHSLLPRLAGVKFVSTNLDDFARVQSNTGFDALWAPEPKLQAAHLNPSGYVLAEPYYAAIVKTMSDSYSSGDVAAAAAAQKVNDDLHDAVGPFGRYVMQLCSPSLAQGDSRLPVLLEYTSANITKLDSDLKALGFFNSSCHR